MQILDRFELTTIPGPIDEPKSKLWAIVDVFLSKKRKTKDLRLYQQRGFLFVTARIVRPPTKHAPPKCGKIVSRLKKALTPCSTNQPPPLFSIELKYALYP